MKRIVPLFEISRILEDHPAVLWDPVRDPAGINDAGVFSCFAGRERGYAIGIGNLRGVGSMVVE